MAYANPNNVVILHGNLANDPQVYDNSDGSKKVLVTVACQRTRKNAEGKRDADFIQCEHFISKDAKGMGPYDPAYMKKGTQVTIMATQESGRYTDKATGETVFYVKNNIVDVSLGNQPRGNSAETEAAPVEDAGIEDAAAKLAAAAAPAGAGIPL